MGRQAAVRGARTITFVRGAAVVLGIVVVTAFAWLVTVAPAVVSFAIAIGAAMAWCAWLQKHPEMLPDTDQSTQDVVTCTTRTGLSVHVLATTLDGTRCALTIAKRLTDGLDARVVLLVPRLSSFAARFDPAGPERAALVDEYRALAADVGVHVNVLFCVCHRYEDVVHQMLGRSSLVIIGGRHRLWWPGREERLVSRLSAAGYPVVFADGDARRRTHAALPTA